MSSSIHHHGHRDRTLERVFNDPFAGPPRHKHRGSALHEFKKGSPPEGSSPLRRRRSAPHAGDPLAEIADSSLSSVAFKQGGTPPQAVHFASSSTSKLVEIVLVPLTPEQEMKLLAIYEPVINTILTTCTSITTIDQLSSKVSYKHSINQEQFALSLLIDSCQGYFSIHHLYEDCLDHFHRNNPAIFRLGQQLKDFYYSANEFQREFLLKLIEKQVAEAFPRELTERQVHMRSVETCERMLMQLHQCTLNSSNFSDFQHHIQAISSQLEGLKLSAPPPLPDEENLELLQALRTKLFIHGHSLGLIPWEAPSKFDAFKPIRRFLTGDFQCSRLNQAWRKTATQFMNSKEMEATFNRFLLAL